MNSAARNRILVTTDGSDLGQQAIAHASSLARALSADLVVLSVLPDPVPTGEFVYIPPPTPQEEQAQEDALRARLEGELPSGALRVERAGGRSVARTIIERAQAERAALIVMSTHGRSGLGRALLGSVAEAVAHHSPVPVLLVRGGMAPHDWDEG